VGAQRFQLLEAVRLLRQRIQDTSDQVLHRLLNVAARIEGLTSAALKGMDAYADVVEMDLGMCEALSKAGDPRLASVCLFGEHGLLEPRLPDQVLSYVATVKAVMADVVGPSDALEALSTCVETTTARGAPCTEADWRLAMADLVSVVENAPPAFRAMAVAGALTKLERGAKITTGLDDVVHGTKVLHVLGTWAEAHPELTERCFTLATQLCSTQGVTKTGRGYHVLEAQRSYRIVAAHALMKACAVHAPLLMAEFLQTYHEPTLVTWHPALGESWWQACLKPEPVPLRWIHLMTRLTIATRADIPEDWAEAVYGWLLWQLAHNSQAFPDIASLQPLRSIGASQLVAACEQAAQKHLAVMDPAAIGEHADASLRNVWRLLSWGPEKKEFNRQVLIAFCLARQRRGFESFIDVRDLNTPEARDAAADTVVWLMKNRPGDLCTATCWCELVVHFPDVMQKAQIHGGISTAQYADVLFASCSRKVPPVTQVLEKALKRGVHDKFYSPFFGTEEFYEELVRAAHAGKAPVIDYYDCLSVLFLRAAQAVPVWPVNTLLQACQRFHVLPSELSPYYAETFLACIGVTAAMSCLDRYVRACPPVVWTAWASEALEEVRREVNGNPGHTNRIFSVTLDEYAEALLVLQREPQYYFAVWFLVWMRPEVTAQLPAHILTPTWMRDAAACTRYPWWCDRLVVFFLAVSAVACQPPRSILLRQLEYRPHSHVLSEATLAFCPWANSAARSALKRHFLHDDGAAPGRCAIATSSVSD
jgi:hypothetical protein